MSAPEKKFDFPNEAEPIPEAARRQESRPGKISPTTIGIKPHHFVDIISALGEGRTQYEPHPYGHALHIVAAEILANPSVPLQIIMGADDICGPCGHNVNGLCDDTIDTSFRPQAPRSKREWNLSIDQRWCERLGLQPGDGLTARELGRLIRDRAGDITDIYREIPAPQTAERQAKLKKGLKEYLEESKAKGKGFAPSQPGDRTV